MPSPIKAALFDVGGPIDTEVTREALIDAQIRAAVVAQGIPVSNAEFAAANAWAVAVFAPNAYHAITWYLTRHDPEIAGRLGSLQFPGGDLEVRPGIADVLRALHTQGLRLGLAANQPTRVVEALDGHGIGHLFAHREVTGHHGFRKPDVRLFLRACEDLGVQPEECVMVGDRIDNDIYPAKSLGMAAILFRTGRHRDQQPRTLDEVPDAEVTTVEGLATALEALISARR